MSKLECPKFLLNGPCEGVRLSGHCEIEPAQTCTFVNAGDLSADIPFSTDVYLYHPPMDWSESPFEGRKRPQQGGTPAKLSLPPDVGADTAIRSGSKFERLLREEEFVVTCEVVPPATREPADFLKAVSTLSESVDAVQVADNWQASLQLSGLLAAYLIEKTGLETILHMSSRDRNRNQLQADTLGACGVGVKNILCLTGEHPRLGDHPEVRPVFDLDLVQLIHVLRHMRDEGELMSGRAFDDAPRVFIGGAIAPLAPPLDYRPHDLGKKVAAGADFVVTNVVFALDELEQFLKRIEDAGLDKKAYVLVSTGVLTNLKMARFIQENVPGVLVPQSLIARLEAVPSSERRLEGIKCAVEFVQRLRKMPAVSGVNLVPRLSGLDLTEVAHFCDEAGLTPRPRLNGTGER